MLFTFINGCVNGECACDRLHANTYSRFACVSLCAFSRRVGIAFLCVCAQVKQFIGLRFSANLTTVLSYR